QLMVGGLAAVWVGVGWTFLPPALHWVVALFVGMMAGMGWGMIVGIFRAYLNVNEVITSIMLNYIGLYGVNFIIKNSYLFDPLKNQTVNIAPAAVIPQAGLEKIFYVLKGRFIDSSSVNAGIIIAIGFALLIYVVMQRTTFGYEIKASGFNRDASLYAGISVKKSIIASMAIAGALSGVAGALMYLAPINGMHIHVVEVLAGQGFNGIAVALLGMSNPIGIIFSGLFIAHITVGGSYLQSLKYMREIIDVIIGVIIYFSAFALFVRDLFGNARRNKKISKENQVISQKEKK
ncbi:MAG: ABC transporter permease, partial [Clostridiales bacterium]|nr:ABC transporter permease [Clostridiales bacterium]